MIKVTAEGYVTDNVRINEAGDTGRFVNFGLSVRSQKPKAERKDRQFINVEIFVRKDGKLADYIKGGKRIMFVNGGLYYDDVEKEGKSTRYWKVRVNANDITLLGDGPAKGSGEAKPASDGAKTEQAAPASDEKGGSDWDG